jgi:hypothetical protein
MERHAVWLAALLHDIGKFQQRAVWGSGVYHQELGARWCEQPYFQQFGSDLAEAVLNHHDRNFPRTNEQRTRLYQLVQLADHLAAGERETETRPQEKPPQSRLVNIFSRIPLEWQNQKQDQKKTHHEPTHPKNAIPCKPSIGRVSCCSPRRTLPQRTTTPTNGSGTSSRASGRRSQQTAPTPKPTSARFWRCWRNTPASSPPPRRGKKRTSAPCPMCRCMTTCA